MTKPRTADDIAVEHGALARDGDGWTTGAMVNCSVQKGSGAGGRSDLAAFRREVDDPDAQVSIRHYAQISGLPEDNVRRIVVAWANSAAKGLVPPMETLKPSDLPRVLAALPNEAEHPWKDAYKGLGRNGPDAARERMIRDPERLVAKMNHDQREAMVHAVVKVEPEVVVNTVTEQVKADPEVADKVYKAATVPIHQAQERHRKEQVFNYEARVVQDGGRVPSNDELNAKYVSPTGTLDLIFQRRQLLDRARDLCQQAADVIAEARAVPIPWEEPDEEKVRTMALLVLAAQDVAATTNP